MTDFINVNVSNPSTGETDINNFAFNSTENKLQDLLGQIEKPTDEDSAFLSSVNSVVGQPQEMEIEVESLMTPSEEWIKNFTPASDFEIQKMAMSIYKYGLLHRITIWQQNDNNFMILGGLTRTAAFKYLYEVTGDKKWLKIPAKVYTTDQIDEIDAKRIFIVSNTDSRQMTTKNIAFAYYNLIKLEKQRAFYGSKIYSRDAAARQANVSPATFNNYLKLIELYPPLFEEIDKGNCQMMVAYEIAFLKEELQKYIYDKKYFLDLSRKTAKAIRTQAKTLKDIDKIITDKNKIAKVFNYNIQTANKLPEDCDVLFTFANTKYKADILKIFSDAVNTSSLPEEIKDEVLQNLS